MKSPLLGARSWTRSRSDPPDQPLPLNPFPLLLPSLGQLAMRAVRANQVDQNSSRHVPGPFEITIDWPILARA